MDGCGGYFVGCEVVVMCYGDYDVFMCGGDCFWDFFFISFGVGFNDRCKVRVRVDKEIVNVV